MPRAFLFLLSVAAVCAPALAQTCQLRDLEPGDSRSDSVAAGCRLRDLVAGSRDNSIGIPYRISFPSPGIFTAEMRSTAVDSVLALVSLTGSLIEANDNISATVRDSRLQVSVEAGTYILFAGGRGTATGAFNLATTHAPRRDCPAADLELEKDAEGELGGSSCAYQDFVYYTDSRTPTAAYRFRVDKRSVARVEMKSAKFSPWFAVFNSAMEEITYGDAEGDPSTEVLVSLEPGDYTILASISNDAAGGAFTLRAELAEPRPCEASPLAFGETVSSELKTGDCRFLDYDAPSDDLSPLKVYRFEIQERGILLAEMGSELFSPWIGVLDEAGQLVASNNDDDPDYIAAVATSLRPGVYRLLASTWDDTGAFLLKVTLQAPRACSIAEIKPGDNLDGSLVDGGCRVADVIAPTTDGGYAAPYRIRMSEPALLTADLVSTRFDAVLYLFASDQLFLAGDDNGGGGSNARLNTYLSAGEYTLIATSNRLRVGAFSLRTTAAAPPSCEARQIEPDASVTGTVEANDCRLREQVTGALSAANAKRFRITLSAPGTIRLEAASRQAPVVVMLTDAQGNFIRMGNPGLNAAAKLSKRLEAGTYTVLVAASQGAGFELKSSFTQDSPKTGN